jgi:uncharacterized membrane protein YuzA (DUF378 family)
MSELHDDNKRSIAIWRAPLDFLTLCLVLLGGIELGAIGLFGFSVLTWLFGHWQHFVYDAIGLAAIWQIMRQRLFG